MKQILFIILATVLYSCHVCKTNNEYTNIVVKNSSDLDSVQVYLTLQSPNSVIGMFGIKETDTVGSRSQGYFYALKDSSYWLNSKSTLFGWNISFHAPPQSCSGAINSGFPNGINIVEGSINTKYEVVDISCVDGVNSKVKLSVSDTVNWTTGNSNYQEQFISATNDLTIENNCNLRGIFPYRCTDCVDYGSPVPENCFNLDSKCDSLRVCQVARTGHAGGNIIVEFIK